MSVCDIGNVQHICLSEVEDELNAATLTPVDPQHVYWGAFLIRSNTLKKGIFLFFCLSINSAASPENVLSSKNHRASYM